jgi:hypothetical protein
MVKQKLETDFPVSSSMLSLARISVLLNFLNVVGKSHRQSMSTSISPK